LPSPRASLCSAREILRSKRVLESYESERWRHRPRTEFDGQSRAGNACKIFPPFFRRVDSAEICGRAQESLLHSFEG